ncbi:MAG: hypothetical protein ABIA63_13630, partial [bacterium]
NGFNGIISPDTALLLGIKKCTVTIDGNISSLDSDSVFYRTITMPQESLKIEEKKYRVIPQLFQMGASFDSINQQSVTRYFEINDTATLQRAFSDVNGIHNVRESMALPHMIYSNKIWPVTPLLLTPITLAQGNLTFIGQAVMVKYYSTTEFLRINGNEYSDGIVLNLYYTLSGTIINKGEIERIAGSIISEQYYFKDRGLLKQEIKSNIQSNTVDGSVKIHREYIYMDRGPFAVKIYPEQLK